MSDTLEQLTEQVSVPIILFQGTFEQADEIIKRRFKELRLNPEAQYSYDCFQHLRSSSEFETRISSYSYRGELICQSTRSCSFEQQLRDYFRYSEPPYCIITGEKLEEAIRVAEELEFQVIR